MGSIRVFASFDCEHDQQLYERLERQASSPGAGFAILGRSEPFAPTTTWLERARERISAADLAVFICGEHTDEAEGVSAEIELAQSLGKPYFLIWGWRDLMCTKPSGAKPAEGMYSWTSPILREQMDQIARGSQWEKTASELKRQRPA